MLYLFRGETGDEMDFLLEFVEFTSEYPIVFWLYSCTNEKDMKFIERDVHKLYINPNSDHNIFTVRIIDHEIDIYVENSKGVFERILKSVRVNF